VLRAIFEGDMGRGGGIPVLGKAGTSQGRAKRPKGREWGGFISRKGI